MEFIVFNTPKQAMNFIKERHKRQKTLITEMYGTDYPIYQLVVNDKKEIIEITGWRCGCGCDRGSTTATVIGRLKKQKLQKK